MPARMGISRHQSTAANPCSESSQRSAKIQSKVHEDAEELSKLLEFGPPPKAAAWILHLGRWTKKAEWARQDDYLVLGKSPRDPGKYERIDLISDGGVRSTEL